jgi:hypothetical protein
MSAGRDRAGVFVDSLALTFSSLYTKRSAQMIEGPIASAGMLCCERVYRTAGLSAIASENETDDRTLKLVAS